MNILRSRLKREGYQAPDRCEATHASMQEWHDFLQKFLETEEFDRLNAMNQAERPISREPSKKFDVTDYKEYRFPTLYEAVCLWVEVHPHHPVTNLKARIKLGELKGAIKGGRLRCAARNGLVTLVTVLSGTDPEPSDHQRVSLVELRRYADRINAVPKFLEHVQVPVELPPPDSGVEGKGTTPPTPETPEA